ncbi:MAG: hypothetical protein QM820_06990 [Minicystis sp.]
MFAGVACSTYSDIGSPCTVDADCASGVCKADGTCLQPTTSTSSSGGAGGEASSSSSASSGGAGGQASSSSSTSSSSTSSSTSSSSGGQVCAPNDDGTITRQESPLGPGLHAIMKIADDATCNTAGTGTSPNKVWDLSGALTNDHQVTIQTLPMDPNDPKAPWCAKDFPGATYATAIADPMPVATHQAHDHLGVFQLTNNELLLMGVCSSKSAAQTAAWTEVSYNPPVTVLKFPMKLNDTWSTQKTTFPYGSAVTGTFEGTAIYPGSTIESTSTVDARGKVKTPNGDIPVLRVHTEAIAAWGFVQTTKQNHALVAECYGTVATFLSPEHEFSTDYNDCYEVWRLVP